MGYMADSVSSDFKQINGLDSQKKTLLAAFLFVLFVISLLVGANLNKKADNKTGTDTQQTATIRPKTRLTLTPSTATLKVGTTQKVSVDLLELPVTAADIVISFDPEVYSVSNIQNGTVFDRVLTKKIDKGSLTFSGAVAPEQAFSAEKGTLFTFTIKALKDEGSKTIEFDTQKTITALNGENTLGLSTGATYKISK